MKITNIIRVAVAGFVLAAFVGASEVEAQQQAGDIVIENAWVGATNPGATVGAGYVTIRNSGPRSERLTSAASDAADHVELHEMSVTNGMMRMHPVAAIEIPAGGAVTLAPGGLHIMFLDIGAPFAVGSTVPVTMHFEHQGDVQVEFTVRRRDGR
ncbi:MAG: copper chaperone PCu(A)C [Hyphomonadaceae bacterium]